MKDINMIIITKKDKHKNKNSNNNDDDYDDDNDNNNNDDEDYDDDDDPPPFPPRPPPPPHHHHYHHIMTQKEQFEIVNSHLDALQSAPRTDADEAKSAIARSTPGACHEHLGVNRNRRKGTGSAHFNPQLCKS